MHAHIDPSIASRDLLGLRAVIFAASRSLAESKLGLKRQKQDLLTVWGVGVHPGVNTALERYDPSEFNSLVDQTAYVGEVGLDAKVPSRLPRQHEVFASVLTELQAKPRLTSIHSYGATGKVVDHLEQTPVKGAILHWWLGDRVDTNRALELGAYFSVNIATLRRNAAVELIPLERLIPETDHPDGNRRGDAPHQPGNVTEVEEALASARGISAAEVRLQAWRNLVALVASTATRGLLPPRVAAILDSAP